jgi:hypothetical protein
MAKFWTFLILTYPVLGENAETIILFPSAKQCGDAMPVIYEPIREVYRDSMAQCRQTSILSSSPRPRARPDNLTESE